MHRSNVQAAHGAYRAPQRQGLGQPDFRRLLGARAWATLPRAVRARFGPAHQAVRYLGTMQVRANAVGWAFAQVCRLIGTPLAPWQGEQAPVVVDVRPGVRGGVVWDRTYHFAGRPPLLVSSRKVLSADGSLMEMVRGGLGMRLEMTAENGALVFRSQGYFLQLWIWRVPIPTILTPGAACVTHTDLGASRFRFTLSFDHQWWGRTIFQTGVFEDPAQR